MALMTRGDNRQQDDEQYWYAMGRDSEEWQHHRDLLEELEEMMENG